MTSDSRIDDLRVRHTPGLPGESPRADALRDALACASALLPFGAALGIVIGSSAMGNGAAILGAPLVYGGSAQLTAATTFAHGAGPLTVVVAALTVSARLLLYGAALAPRFRDQPLWFRLVGAHCIVDPTYVASLGRPAHRGRAFRVYWLGLGLGVLVVWTAAIGAGVLVGPLLPTLPHLPLAGTALFIGMLMPRVTDRPKWTAAGVAAIATVLAVPIVPMAAVVVGTAAGMIAGLVAGGSADR